MIRAATIQDVPALVSMAGALAAESPEWRAMGFNAGRASAMLSTLVDSPHGFVAVAEVGGAICGAIVAAASEHWACDALQAFELGLYVSPDMRGAELGRWLASAYAEWAAAIGAKRATAGVTTGLQPEAVARMYEAAGARRLGLVFDFVQGVGDVHKQ